MFVKQISIYLENVKGSLCELTQLLGENQINLLALSIADTTGFGIVRCIVKSADMDKALAALKDGGYVARTNSVVCVSIPHHPMGLANVLSILEKNDLSVEYTYSFCRSTIDDAVIIIRPTDKEKCIVALKENGVHLLGQEDIDKF